MSDPTFKKCVIPFCKTTSENNYFRLFDFPKYGSEKYHFWLKKAKLSLKRGKYFICGKHFRKIDFGGEDYRLIENAFPSVALGFTARIVRTYSRMNTTSKKSPVSPVKEKKKPIETKNFEWMGNENGHCNISLMPEDVPNDTNKEIVNIKIEEDEDDDNDDDDDDDDNSSIRIDPSTKYDLENTCRTCRAQNVSLEKIFKDLNDAVTTTDFNIADELMYLKLNISDDDHELPQKMCTNCVNRLSNIHEFRMECKRSQVIFENYFKNKHGIDKRISLKQEPPQQVQAKIENVDGLSGFEFINIFENANDLIKKENVSTEVESSNDTVVNINNTNSLNEDNYHENTDTDTDDDDDDDNGNSDSTSITSNSIDDDTKSNNMTTIKKRKYSRRVPIQPTDYDTFCDKCGIYFKNIGACRYHRTKGKCVVLNDEFVCRFCNQKFRNANTLNNHLRSIHPFKGRLYSCSMCDKRFKLPENYDLHIKSHFTDNPFRCELCDRVYQNESSLNDHKKYAHTISEHKCDQCSMMFNNKRRYQYHLKTHNPVKPFKCKYCDKSFIANSNLMEHERVHTGARPWLCNICGKDFRANSTFVRHLLYHSGERPYICSICKNGFQTRSEIIQHMQSHHHHTIVVQPI